MKFSILVSLMALASIATSMQTASAQESRGARFNYAPNVWKSESVRMPKGYGAPDPVHNVRAGAVPSGNLLGIDPSMFTKPAPPPPVIAARPATTSVTPAMFIPKANASFNPQFGKPQVAQLPASAVPQQAVAMPMQMKPIAATNHHAPVVAARHSTQVAGRMLRPAFRNVAPATASPAVASYPTNFGYSPGPLLPSSSSGGGSASTKVSGVLIGRSARHK
jgi:hypothetical protein